jgi:predicted TPR repeat methyltransferase
LLNSFAHAHALFLRADARLDMNPPNIEGAIEDAKLATELAPDESKGWRVLANAQEAIGNIEGAIDAFREWARVDVSFSTKSKKEIERLSCLL